MHKYHSFPYDMMLDLLITSTADQRSLYRSNIDNNYIIPPQQRHNKAIQEQSAVTKSSAVRLPLSAGRVYDSRTRV